MTMIQVRMTGTRSGPELRITTEPYATAEATLAGFERTATKNFRGIKFRGETVRKLTRWWLPVEMTAAYWAAATSTNRALQDPDTDEVVSLDCEQSVLDDLLTAVAAVDNAVSAAKGQPAQPQYHCMGRPDGCQAIVSTPDTYCPHCQHDI